MEEKGNIPNKILEAFSKKGVIGLMLLVLLIVVLASLLFMTFTYKTSLQVNQENISAILEQNKTNNDSLSASTKAMVEMTVIIKTYITNGNIQDTFFNSLYEAITEIEDANNQLANVLIIFGQRNNIVWTSEINSAIILPKTKVGKVKGLLFKQK